MLGVLNAYICRPSTSHLRHCYKRASTIADFKDDDDDDLDFFKKCIVDVYCFQKPRHETVWTKLPTFAGVIDTAYFTKTAKRVELFFIRNNDWSRTIVNPKFRVASTRECTNLLYVTAARYMYVIYVLNLLRDQMTFAPCDEHAGSKKIMVPAAGACFPVPHDVVTCTSDFDIALVGERSGTLAALFNQFFREPLGTDPIVAGFGKSVEEIFDTNVHAFTLEYAMPAIFGGITREFHAQVNIMNGYIKFKVQEVVSAIIKMKSYNRKYFNDLMSDQVELRNTATKHKLQTIFHDWAVQFQAFNDAVRSLMRSDQYTTIISFRRKQHIAYEMVAGIIESVKLPEYIGKALAQTAIALMYASEAYHTRGTIRHVVGIMQMQRGELKSQMTTNDYWVSMLENWADAVKEYNRECAAHSLRVVVCLPKMSKYLLRMLDAMHAIRSRLYWKLKQGLLVVDNARGTGIRAIVAHWLHNVKRKGYDAIPERETRINIFKENLAAFLEAFKCPSLSRHDVLRESCMDAIQAEIRKYNRRLFLDLVNSDRRY